MSATVSTEFLLRVAQATPEQQAAIDRFLRGVPCELSGSGEAAQSASAGGVAETLLRIERKLDGLVAAARRPEKREPMREGECLRVFHLFGELLAMGTDLAASPARVFDLMVFRKLTKAETAVKCKCAASLITRRVAAIEAHFGMPIEKLCDFASDIRERQRSVRGDRYAKKRRGAIRDEREQYDDGDKPGVKEDEEGYLPEERQSCD